MIPSTAVDVACLLCGSTRPHAESLDGVLSTCSQCAFTWTTAVTANADDGAATGEAEALYGDDYFRGEGYEDYFQPSARRYEASLRLRWMLAGGPVATLVEAGSAAGFFVEAAAQAGIAAYGIELSEGAARYARDQLRVDVRRGAFESCIGADRVDVVCAFHVLEHVADPRVFLAAAFAALEPGGRLLVEVPNVTSGAARRMGAQWPGLQPQFHRWHFAPGTLSRMVIDAGFEVEHRDTAVFRSYMPPRYRRRRAHHLLPSDLRHTHSLRLSHPLRGDLLRLTARRPALEDEAAR
jgi:SAM-dependent methyltransferase